MSAFGAQKPKLAFFQVKYDRRLPEFLLTHKNEHVKCLSKFFDVVLINDDCDYQEVCDIHRPDLALFESGVNHGTCRRLDVKNIHSCPEVPKLGLHHADGFCDARAGFLSDMEHWGIETFFGISVTAGEHTPSMGENLFTWPVFFDPDVHHDRGSPKVVPVLFTGNRDQFYPWRGTMLHLLSRKYPSLICPHPGYAAGAPRTYVVVGEAYARMINASLFVPACGTVAKEVVRKHFEVPANRACLIAQTSAGLAAAGFVDMENCVLGEGEDVLHKVEWLIARPEELDRLIGRGYELAHSRHALGRRNQIFEWFCLHKERRPDERIVQLNPFDPPVLVQAGSDMHTVHVRSNGMHLQLLKAGDEKLFSGRYREAEELYLRCTAFMRWMPEPRLRLAICSLYLGDAGKARSWLEGPINFVLNKYEAKDPDPVEWAYFIISWLCAGDLQKAAKLASEYPWLHQEELDRTRRVVQALGTGHREEAFAPYWTARRRRSLHTMPARSEAEWLKEVCTMLAACGQTRMAAVIEGLAPATNEQSRDSSRGSGSGSWRYVAPSSFTRNDHSGRSMLKRRALRRRAVTTARRYLGRALHSLERRFGYFLPYSVSISKGDEFYASLREIARSHGIRGAVAVGVAPGEATTEALLAGLGENESRPFLHCIQLPGNRAALPPRTGTAGAAWHSRAAGSSANVAYWAAGTLERIRDDAGQGAFDLFVIRCDERIGQLAGSASFIDAVYQARFVVIEGLVACLRNPGLHALLDDRAYATLAWNPELRSGYAVLKKDAEDLSSGLGSTREPLMA